MTDPMNTKSEQEPVVLTAEIAKRIWNRLAISRSTNDRQDALALDAIASGAVICKTAAAEREMQERIRMLEESVKLHKDAIAEAFRRYPDENGPAFCVLATAPLAPITQADIDFANEALKDRP